MAAMRFSPDLSKVNWPARRCSLLQPESFHDQDQSYWFPNPYRASRPSSKPPGVTGMHVPLHQMGPSPGAFPSVCFPLTGTLPEPTQLSQSRLEHLLCGDGDSGYSGSPEVHEERSRSLLSSKVGDSVCGLSVSGPVEDTRERLHVIKQEPPDYTNAIAPCHEASSQPSFFPRASEFSTMWSNSPANAHANPDFHARNASFRVSSNREHFHGETYPTERTRVASIKGKQQEASLDKTTTKIDYILDLVQDSTPTNISHNDDMVGEPSTCLHSPSNPGSNLEATAKFEVRRWVDATKDASPFPSFTPPAIPSASSSDRSSPAAPVQALSTRENPTSSSRELVLEFWSILQDRDQDYDAYESSQADESTEWFTDDMHSLRTSTNGSGSNGSPNSSATSNSTPIGLTSKNALSTNKRGPEREEDEDGCPNKRPTREQGVSVPDALQDSSYLGQMSCPMLELHDCQGTNSTISELMRCLTNRHRIVICKECCTRLHVPEEEKKPANILQKHALEGCERYCIGTSCANNSNASTSFHRRTERCPSWATLTKEARWTFIWRLVNPESNPPEPNFLPGPAFEHSQIRKPCKQQARARGNEICAQLMRDIEAKERRISTLENDLITVKNEKMQTQQRCNEKTVNLENIIESLLEPLCENGIGLRGSLRKRLQNECPEVMATIPLKESQTVSTLPTSTLTPNHGYYPGPGESSTWGNMTCPPPTMPTMPVTWDAVPQQMVGSNPGYHFPDFSEKAPTTSEMYPTDACISDWNSISMSPSTMHAQAERYSSSETPEIVQPCE